MPPEALDFSRRADGPELMDLPCTYEEFRGCLRDLRAVNQVTLGYRPTLQWLSRVLRLHRNRSMHIVDVGCGGGDMLRRIARWAAQHSIRLKLTGIDLNPYAIAAAQEWRVANEQIEWVTGDAFSYTGRDPVDIVISSLFTHHLPDHEIVSFLRWMEGHAKAGWFVNDLHRRPQPYRLFRALAKVMRWHRFVRHDGPLSIRRSFDWDDWRRLCERANITGAHVETFRPGRLCVGRIKQLAAAA